MLATFPTVAELAQLQRNAQRNAERIAQRRRELAQLQLRAAQLQRDPAQQLAQLYRSRRIG